MSHKKLLEIIKSLSSNHFPFVDSKDIHKLLPEDIDQGDVHYLAHDLHSYGFIILEPSGCDFRAELTPKGRAYLLSS